MAWDSVAGRPLLRYRRERRTFTSIVSQCLSDTTSAGVLRPGYPERGAGQPEY
jgi:hypothetical protein